MASCLQATSTKMSQHLSSSVAYPLGVTELLCCSHLRGHARVAVETFGVTKHEVPIERRERARIVTNSLGAIEGALSAVVAHAVDVSTASRVRL